MQSENEYIGDDKFKKFLEHYECPTPLNIVKMKFAGAICSPNMNLRPADVISSLWASDKQPRLETKKEAELFFKFFMGLWDDIFSFVKRNKLVLPKMGKTEKNNLQQWCKIRYEELELGWLEGFWGGCSNLNIPAYIAEIIDSLSEMADVYNILAKKETNGDNIEEIRKTLSHTDKMVERAIAFVIENSVLPRIEDLKRSVN